jgi:hypothetical protein
MAERPVVLPPASEERTLIQAPDSRELCNSAVTRRAASLPRTRFHFQTVSFGCASSAHGSTGPTMKNWLNGIPPRPPAGLRAVSAPGID